MNRSIYLILLMGTLGAFDTLYYHEYKLRLPHTHSAGFELKLHATRDAAYALIFISIAWLAWTGVLAWLFLAILAFEIVVTMWDFLEEDRTRRLPPGERVGHATMGIVYGAFLYTIFPTILEWATRPTGIEVMDHGWASWLLTAFAFGVAGSGVRDYLASRGLAGKAGVGRGV